MKRTPEQWREYRAKRKADGKKVPSGGKRMRKADYGEFLAVDGEGADFPDGSHRYILLSAAHTNGGTWSISDPNGLDADRALCFLTKLGERYPNAIACVFSGTYDAVKLLQPLLDEEGVKELWLRARMRHPDGKRTMRRGRWIMSYQPAKQLYISDAMTDRSLTLWDVWGFFQASFVNTLRDWMPDYPELEMIATQKARRGEFDPSELPELQRYCEAEVRALAHLMELLRQRVEEAGLRLNRWDGAGAVGAALLKAHGVKAHKRETPPELLDPAARAYFGGRIELLRYGHHIGTVYHYDINSAYPSHACDLPSLANGEWAHWTGPAVPPDYVHGFTLCHVAWDLRARGGDLYPFPYRYPNGSVHYPGQGEGWYWRPEVEAALEHLAAYSGDIRIIEGWTFIPHTEDKPFTFLRDIFELRKAWKREGKKAEYILKLGMNSVYGKLAQQVGSNPDKPPPYHQLEWAGYITSATRAQLYRAAMQRPEALVMLATDGIITTAPLELDVSTTKELGKWEASQHDELITVQSGVYWWRDGEHWHTKTRGFSGAYDGGDLALTPARVLAAWERHRASRELHLDCLARRNFVGFGAVAAGQRPYSDLGTWQQELKRLALYPTGKRWRTLEQANRARPWERLEPTMAEVNQFPGLCSTPHLLAWMAHADGRLERKLEARERAAT